MSELVNNRHPLVPLSTMKAGFRLVLHGLATEMQHALLVQYKRAQRLTNSGLHDADDQQPEGRA